MTRKAIRSRKPEAKKFKRWITHSVLPSIRKSGVYHTPDVNPDFLRQIADRLEAETKRVNEAERTKAHISRTREASAMGKLSGANKKIKKLEEKYENPSRLATRGIPWLKDYFQKLADKEFPWGPIGTHLTNIGKEMGYDAPRVASDRYPNGLRVHHVDVIALFKNRVERGEISPRQKECLRRR